jgi:hypothetical protein
MEMDWMDREGPTVAAFGAQIFGPRCYNLSFDARGRAALAEQCYTQTLRLAENRAENTPSSQIFQDIPRYSNCKRKTPTSEVTVKQSKIGAQNGKETVCG